MSADEVVASDVPPRYFSFSLRFYLPSDVPLMSFFSFLKALNIPFLNEVHIKKADIIPGTLLC